MKRSHLCSTVVVWVTAFVFSPSRAAEDEPAKGKPEKTRAHAELFKKLDKDGDGKVTAEEVKGNDRAASLYGRLLKVADGDGDNALNEAEFLQGLARERPRAGGDRPNRGRGGRRDRPDPKRFVERFDKNGDGKVGLDEVPKERKFVRQLIETHDKDGDGALGVAELEEAFRNRNRGGRNRNRDRTDDRPQGADALFRLLDVDGDRTLSQDDLVQFAAKFKRLDRDGDGRISFEELMASARHPRGPDSPGTNKGKGIERVFRRLDKNGDSLISQDEAQGRIKNRFRELDANGDGQLDREELVQGFKRRDAGRGKPRGARKRPEADEDGKREF